MPYQKYSLLVGVLLQASKAQVPLTSATAGALGLQQSTQLDFARSRFPSDFGTLPKGKYGTIDKNSLASPSVSVLRSPWDLFQLDTRMSTTGTSKTILVSNIESLEKAYAKLAWTLAIYRRDSSLQQQVPGDSEWKLVTKTEMSLLEPQLPIQIPKGGQFLIALENVTFKLRGKGSGSGIIMPRFSLNSRPTQVSGPII